MTEQPLRHHNNLHSCKAVVLRNVGSFKYDDTLQRKSAYLFNESAFAQTVERVAEPFVPLETLVVGV